MYNKVIHSIIKDESHILNEWIIHNINNIGFDHIYIYDDQSEIPITITISSLPSNILSKITVFTIEKNIYFYDHNLFKESIFYDENIYLNNKDNKQFYFLNYFLHYFRNVSEWCLFCDIDEFIYLNETTLDEILFEYNNYDIIHIPWLIYGSSFHIDQPKGLIIDNFKYHNNKYNEIGKSICRLNSIPQIDHVHYISVYQPRFSFDYNQKIYTLPIHINHYQINSIKLYVKRKLRKEIGYINGKMRLAQDIFLFMLAYNCIYNNSMDKYIKNINKILKCPLTNLGKNLNYKYSINCIYIDNKLYFKMETYDEINKILTSNNIKYLKFEDYLPKDFDINIYKKLNNDLGDMNDIELLNHFVLFGNNENRKYKLSKKEYVHEKKKLNVFDDDEDDDDEDDNDDDSIESNTDSSDISDDKSEKSIYLTQESEDSISIESSIDDDNNGSILPYDFDVLVYKSLNPDLQQLSNINAIYHFLNNGINEKRKYKINTLPNDFDPNIYKELNKDLRDLSNKECEDHYVNYGIEENRKYKKNNLNKEKIDLLPDDFDPKIYKKINSDLAHLSLEEASNHYLKNGKKEKRKYKKEHLNDKKDLKGLKKEKNLKKEDNIKIPIDFDPEVYKKLNKDLRHLNNEEAINHYLTFGIKENRNYCKIKKIDNHIVINNKSINKDENNDDDNSIIENSSNENTDEKSEEESSEDEKIDLLKIKKFTKKREDIKGDIKGDNKEDNKEDIKENNKENNKENIKENKSKNIKLFKKEKKNKSLIPEDFNVDLYIKLNPDLQHLSNIEALSHYINYGINENRKYKPMVDLPDDFDPVIYKKLNKDLQHMTDKEAIIHYLINGYNEKRRYIKLKSS